MTTFAPVVYEMADKVRAAPGARALLEQMNTEGTLDAFAARETYRSQITYLLWSEGLMREFREESGDLRVEITLLGQSVLSVL